MTSCFSLSLNFSSRSILSDSLDCITSLRTCCIEIYQWLRCQSIGQINVFWACRLVVWKTWLLCNCCQCYPVWRSRWRCRIPLEWLSKSGRLRRSSRADLPCTTTRRSSRTCRRSAWFSAYSARSKCQTLAQRSRGSRPRWPAWLPSARSRAWNTRSNTAWSTARASCARPGCSSSCWFGLRWFCPCRSGTPSSPASSRPGLGSCLPFRFHSSRWSCWKIGSSQTQFS